MNHRHAITRLEILVALVFGFSAVGIVVMLLARQRENGQRAQCMNNLRLIGLAVHAYHDASSGDKGLKRLPPSRLANGYATWAVLIAPYLTKESPLLEWSKQESYFAQKAEVREARRINFFCPARLRSDTLSQAGDVDSAGKLFLGGLGDYANVAGDGDADHDWTGPDANGAFILAEVLERKDGRILQWQSRTNLASLKRGESYTMIVGEKHVPADHQGDAAFGDGSFYNGQHPAGFSRVAGPGFPIAASVDSPFNRNFGSNHNGVCHFLMADTSVRPMTPATSEIVLGQMARRGD